MNVQIPCRFVETKRKYENHFTIAIFKTSKKNIPEEFLDKNERRRKITVSVKGYDIPTPKEYDVLINGDFKVEPVYGYTIVVNSAQIILHFLHRYYSMLLQKMQRHFYNYNIFYRYKCYF